VLQIIYLYGALRDEADECITFASLCEKGSIGNIVGLNLAAWIAVFRAMKPSFPRFYPRLDRPPKKEGRRDWMRVQ